MRSPYRRRRFGALRDRIVAALVLALVALIRRLPPEKAIALGGSAARLAAPILPASGIARENIALAFPDASPAERRRILRGSWDNLGRMAMEFLHLDHLARLPLDLGKGGAIEGREAIDLLWALRDRGGPALLFSAHLANWELLAVLAERENLDLTVLYRPMNNAGLAARVDAARGARMGKRIGSSFGAAAELSEVLERGGLLGLLVDQRLGKGPLVPFLGRPARANPTLARLARAHECPVYGVRAIRLSGGRFRLDAIGPVDLPRDESGAIDVVAATAVVQAIVGDWVREYPDQWLWQHRRWRP